jgi:RNA-binding protein YhbY
MFRIMQFQIGKSGVTKGVINSLNLALKAHGNVRISVLKSSGRNKESIRKMADEIVEKLDYRSNYRIIGFTIVLKKLHK